MSDQRETAFPDERRDRKRRARLTLLAVAAVAAAVLVPLTVHVRHSWEASAGTAGSGSSSSSGGRAPSTRSEGALDVDPEQPWLHQLASDATALATTLNARGETLALTAPGRPIACPGDTGAMSAALGVPLDYVGGSLSDYPDTCEWSTGRSGGPGGNYLSVDIGFLAGWTEGDLQHLDDESCWGTPVEDFAPNALLDACLLEGGGGSTWTLYVPETRGTGVWTLAATAQDNQPVRAPAALDALIDVAAATW